MLKLCVRERELLNLLAQGLMPNEISKKMQLSPRTVEFLVAEIDQKAENSGKNRNPKLSSLLPIVNFFSISISQLIGDENLTLSSIPYLEWQELSKDLSDLSIKAKKTSATDLSHNENLFATTMPDNSMEPRFPKKTTLIFDRNQKAKNASFVLIYRENDEGFSFRMLISKNRRLYIKALNPKNPDSTIVELAEHDQILGVLVQSKTNHVY